MSAKSNRMPTPVQPTDITELSHYYFALAAAADAAMGVSNQPRCASDASLDCLHRELEWRMGEAGKALLASKALFHSELDVQIAAVFDFKRRCGATPEEIGELAYRFQADVRRVQCPVRALRA